MMMGRQGTRKLKRFHSLARVKMTNNKIASIVFHISKEELLFERHVLFVQVKI